MIDADTALEPLGDGRWRGTISERWWVVAGPYGGYVAAFLVRALIAAVDDPERPPRSLTVHFLAPPVVGPVEVTATVERVGGSATSVALRMEQAGRTVAIGVGAAAAWRDGQPEWDDAPAPLAPPPEEAPTLDGARVRPPFWQNFELRWVDGAPGRACNVTWVRALPDAPLDHVTVTALSDTMVPAAFTRLERVVFVPTVDLTIHFRAPLPPPDDDGWVLARYASRRAAGGAWEEDGELWSRDGRLLAQSRQLALIRG